MPRRRPDDVSSYMRWYVKDWMAAVQPLNAEERGAYASLLASMWDNHGKLPLDPRDLANTCGLTLKRWPRVWARIERFFQVVDDGRAITQKRLADELEKARAVRQKRVEAGVLGGRPRAQEGGGSDPRAGIVTNPERGQTVEVNHAEGLDTGKANGYVLPKQNESTGSGIRDPSPNGEIPPTPQRGGGLLSLIPPDPSQGKAPSRGDQVLAVFAHYRRYHPRAFPHPNSRSAEWRKVLDRLNEGHTLEDLQAAIDGYHRNPWHLGQNDRGTKYLDLGLIVRDGAHVARGIEYAASNPAPGNDHGVQNGHSPPQPRALQIFRADQQPR